MKKAAVLNDLSGFGRCSLTAAIPVLSVMGVQCCPIASAVLTGQTGYPHYYSTDLTHMLPLYTRAWKENKESFDAIYSGFMTDLGQIKNFWGFLDEFYQDSSLLLVDPIMGDDGHAFSIFDTHFREGMRDLALMADIITPNLTEACLLAGLPADALTKYQTAEDLIAFSVEVGEKLRSLSGKNQSVVITGIKCRKSDQPVICNTAIGDFEPFVQKAPFFDQSFSGTGDLFASVLCGSLLRGKTVPEGITLASGFLSDSIKDTIRCQGSGRAGVYFENHLAELAERLNDNNIL